MIYPLQSTGRDIQTPRPQQPAAVPLIPGTCATRSPHFATQWLAVLFGVMSVCHGAHAETASAYATVELPALNGAPIPVIAGETLAAWPAVQSFYLLRQQRPAWVAGTALNADGKLLLEALRAVDKEGLKPADYHMPMLASGRLTANDLELLLTDAALRYADDQMTGRFEPRQMDPQWFIAQSAAADVAGNLQAALEKKQFAQWLDGLPPPHPAYAQLRKALAQYRGLAAQAPWPTLEEGPSLKPGEQDARVPVLRQRLQHSDEPENNGAAEVALYDATLADAVRRFQSTQGLEPDGIVGKATRAALNVSAQQRVHQLQANMERWRWLPRQFEARHIRVNMAGFDLVLEEDAKPALHMHVIVGKQLLSTPAFNSRLTHVVFNPSWSIPYSIASKEILPKLKKNPAYLTEENILAFDSWDAGAQPIDTTLIDWSQYTEKNFPFRLRQVPGPRNPLGQMKFLLPNSYAIYLHDTPSRRLFNKSVRALSHGCIRLQKPQALAEYLLGNGTKWNPEAIAAAIAKQDTRTVTLPQPTPIYMLYFTAWVDAEDVVQFRDDIYTRDIKLARAFETVN